MTFIFCFVRTTGTRTIGRVLKRQSKNSSYMQSKLALTLCDERHHPCVMWTRAEFGKINLFIFHKELYTKDTTTAKAIIPSAAMRTTPIWLGSR